LDVSVGICAYNEEENIGALLENLLTQQSLPHNSEIIVVCSGCTDETPSIVEKFARKDKRVKLILEEERRGKARH
jgi:glycosyltransferase involved in cell wall biosynthesis